MGYRSSPAEQSPLRSRNVLVAAVVLLVIAVAVSVVLVTRNDDQPAAARTSASSTSAPSERSIPSRPYVDRAGIDRSNLPEGVGDPAALVTRAEPSPVTLNATEVVQACSLLTVEHVRELPQLRESGIFPLQVSRRFFDGASTFTVDAPDLYAGATENECRYTLYPTGLLSIAVLQPAYHPAGELDLSVRKEYRDAGTVAGFDLYKRRRAKDPAQRDADFLLRDGDAAVVVRLDELRDAQPEIVDPLAKDLLEAVAANYGREAAAPSGPPRSVYDTPAFTAPYLHSCDVLTADDLREQRYGDVYPLVEEDFPATSSVMQRDEPRELTTAMVQNACTRMVVAEGSPVGVSLNSMSFLDRRGAEVLLSELREEWGGSDIPVDVGDDAFFAKVLKEPQIVVRSDRFMLIVSAPDMKGMDKQQFIETFGPITQTIVSNSQDG